MSTVMEHPNGDLSERGGRGRGRRRGPLVAGVVGAAVLVGGGAYAAVAILGAGGGDQPDSVLPASAAVYARVDVNPSVGQKVAAVRFFQGLDPETKARLDAGEWREWAWEQLANGEEVPGDVDFEADIEPWLGDRLGVALVPRGAEQEPIVAVALQVKDGQLALDTLDRLTAEDEVTEGETELAYYLDDDYVVFTTADDLEDLRAAAQQGTLDDHEAYADDMDALGDAGIASVWADASRLGDLAPALADPELDSTGMLDELSTEADLMNGRMAAAVRLSADAIEVTGVNRGMEGLALPAGGSGVDPLVEQLPADTAAAISMENGAAWVQAAWDYYAATYPEDVADVTASAAEEGFTLPDDLKTVLGDSMTLAVGPGVVEAFSTVSETSTGMPELPIGYRAATDAAAVVTLLTDAGMPPSMLAQRTDDGVLTLGLDQAYVDGLAAPEGTLGQDATFRATVDEGADAVFYVNVNAFEQYYLPMIDDEQVRSSLETLAAVGMTSTVESADEGRFTMRFVADEAQE